MRKRTLLIRLPAVLALLTGAACQQEISSQQDSAPDTPPPTNTQSEPGRPATDTPLATAKVGQQVSVTREVAKTNVSRAGHHFIEFKSKDLVLFCPRKNASKFDGGGPAALYKGKTIRVTGQFARFKGGPQIVLNDPSQVQIIGGNASTTKAARNRGVLRKIGKTTWESPAGLFYRGRDPDGLTRVEHVLRHARDAPNRPGPHGVFDAKNEQQVFALIDEAWEKIRSTGIKPRRQGRRDRYIVAMKRRIGYLGGREGNRRRKPALRRLCIILESETTNVVTAYPQ